MLLTKTSPVGIDIPLQRFQTWLHNQLAAKWQLSNDDPSFKCYGRCYRNQTTDGYIAENYEGNGNYAEVYFDDRLKAISFFGITPTERFEIGAQLTEVHLIFFVDLKKLKPEINHRADEEVQKDILNAAGNGKYGFNLTSISTGIENVLREYPGSRRDDRLKYMDMSPRHCFRLNFSLNYHINNC